MIELKFIDLSSKYMTKNQKETMRGRKTYIENMQRTYYTSHYI